MKTANASSHSLLPESFRNMIESVNCASRIALKACQGAERTVEGLDEIATLTLRQQRLKLLAELPADV